MATNTAPILITGAGGQVGKELCLRAGTRNIVACDRQSLDITDAPALAQIMQQYQPALIINAAAYTAVDKAESEQAAAYAINRDGAGTLAQAAAKAGIPLLHISTDYVFDGESPAPYREDDTAAPTGVYGDSKWQGEQAVRQHCPQHIILRVAWVFGAHGHNFVRTMLRLGRERDELSVVADQHGAPTHAGAIAEALLQLAERHLAGQNLPWGTWHYSGTPATSWHGFAQAIFEQAVELGLLTRKPAVKAITTAEFPTPARRPMNSVLDLSRSQAELGLAPKNWRDGLQEMLMQLQANPD